MSQSPVRVEQAEVDRALRIGGTDSPVYRRLREHRDEWLSESFAISQSVATSP